MKKTKGLMVLMLAAILISACSNDGKDGKNSLVDLISEPEGENCESGGIKIISGLDINENNVLEDSEVQHIEYVCNGEDNENDKLVMVEFLANGLAYGTSSTDGHVYDIQVIKNFNITNYANIDSASFQLYLRSDSLLNNCTAELFDITNNLPILNSMLSSDSTDWEWVSTEINFLEDLPEETIDLGIRIKTETEGIMVSYYLPALVLFREQ